MNPAPAKKQIVLSEEDESEDDGDCSAIQLTPMPAIQNQSKALPKTFNCYDDDDEDYDSNDGFSLPLTPFQERFPKFHYATPRGVANNEVVKKASTSSTACKEASKFNYSSPSGVAKNILEEKALAFRGSPERFESVYSTPTPRKPAVQPRPSSSDLEVIKVAGACYYDGKFVSKIMSEKQYYTTCKNIEVKDSSLGGKGVFATKNLRKKCFISAYDGEVVLDRDEAEKSNYALELYSGHFVEASAVGYDEKNKLGHILNSVSPGLEVLEANCIYITILVVMNDGSKVIKGGVWLDEAVAKGDELLCDYHWRIQENCPCASCCKESVRQFIQTTQTSALHTPDADSSQPVMLNRKVTPVTKKRVVDESPTPMRSLRASTLAAKELSCRYELSMCVLGGCV